MAASPIQRLDAQTPKAQLAFRRLLLAKELYLHALTHAAGGGALNQMIAVHNLHNAIEIAVRAILLHFDIRPEKELNISFEVMLDEVDKHEPFKMAKIRLPYRQELRNLSLMRNMVQHHAVEPAASTMDIWKVDTQRILEKLCLTYFLLDFNSLSQLDMIEDPVFRELLTLADNAFREQNWQKCIALSKISFGLASKAIIAFLPVLPNRTVTVPTFEPGIFRQQDEVSANEIERLQRVQLFSAVLATGVALVDYKHLEISTPEVHLNGFRPQVEWRAEPKHEDSARWTFNFSVSTLVRWQIQGLRVRVSDRHIDGVRELIALSKEGKWNGMW